MENQITELLNGEDAINTAARQVIGVAAMLEALETWAINNEIQPGMLEIVSIVLRTVSDNLGRAASYVHDARMSVHGDMPE